MNLAQFLQHWSIRENPFTGEEARHDGVFRRMLRESEASSTPNADPKADAAPDTAANLSQTLTPALPLDSDRTSLSSAHSVHTDFSKVVGDLSRPSSSIVFGEKGSGKTAMRLQIAARIRQHNASSPQRTLLVAYDEFNPFLDRLHARLNARHDSKSALESFQKIRLVDHLDAILLTIVPKVVDALLGQSHHAGEEPVHLADEPRRVIKKLDQGLRRDLLLLQALYDRPEDVERRTAVLRRKLGIWASSARVTGALLASLGWIPAAAVAFLAIWKQENRPSDSMFYLIGALVIAWLVVILKVTAVDRILFGRLGRRLRKQLRVNHRTDGSYARSLVQLDPTLRAETVLPLTDSDDTRYALLGRLKRVLRALGYSGVIVLIDRVDEPTLVNGDPDRMRAIIWPMLNNKFLQQEGLGVKMLLPMDLRHMLYKESSSFFQEARLDKQNMIDRLSWTGAMLYDLCNARLASCLTPGAKPVSLIDLFAEDVTRQDVVDALDQMHQPRDAFKFMYRCLGEHCSNVTAEDGRFRVPRSVLDMIRKQESERVQQLYRGIRPA